MIIFDLDGTLSIVGDRVECLKSNPPDWDSFYDRCDEDKPNWPIIKLFDIIKEKHDVWIVSGRRESTRKKTITWLDRVGINPFPHQLIMRPNGDFRHDTILKPELVDSFKDQISLVFEDRDSMVKKWREMGITCCQVAKGDF